MNVSTGWQNVLTEGFYDILAEADVYAEAKRIGIRKPPDRRMFAVGILCKLLLDELIIAGRATSGAHVEAWDCAPHEAITRVTQTWMTEWPDSPPLFGEVAWFANTAKGNLLVQTWKEAESASLRIPASVRTGSTVETLLSEVETEASAQGIVTLKGLEARAISLGFGNPEDAWTYAIGWACESLVAGSAELIRDVSSDSMSAAKSAPVAIKRMYDSWSQDWEWSNAAPNPRRATEIALRIL